MNFMIYGCVLVSLSVTNLLVWFHSGKSEVHQCKSMWPQPN